MASVLTLGSAPPPRKRRSRKRSANLGAATTAVGTCKCSYNPRTKRNVESCYVGKSSHSRSGWKFTKGGGGCNRR